MLFYATLVFAVAERSSEGTDLECANEDRTESVEICGSYLSNWYGHWNVLKVTRVDLSSIVVNKMLVCVYEEKATQLALVMLIIIFLITLSYYFTDKKTIPGCGNIKNHQRGCPGKFLTTELLFFFKKILTYVHSNFQLNECQWEADSVRPDFWTSSS